MNFSTGFRRVILHIRTVSVGCSLDVTSHSCLQSVVGWLFSCVCACVRFNENIKCVFSYIMILIIVLCYTSTSTLLLLYTTIPLHYLPYVAYMICLSLVSFTSTKSPRLYFSLVFLYFSLVFLFASLCFPHTDPFLHFSPAFLSCSISFMCPIWSVFIIHFLLHVFSLF